MSQESVRFRTDDEVDFVVIGSGAAGGVLAKELSTQGFSVVVMEQGPYIRPVQFRHDDVESYFGGGLIGRLSDHPHSWRASATDDAVPAAFLPSLLYAKAVGGSTLHFAANYWRLRPNDFNERSLLGPIAGTTFADWPISYAELEPYYTKVDWEVGVSGVAAPGDPPRSCGYPVPPMPIKSSGGAYAGWSGACWLNKQAGASRHPLSSAQRPERLHSLRLLLGQRVRGGGQILLALVHDPGRGGHRPL